MLALVFPNAYSPYELMSKTDIHYMVASKDEGIIQTMQISKDSTMTWPEVLREIATSLEEHESVKMLTDPGMPIQS